MARSDIPRSRFSLLVPVLAWPNRILLTLLVLFLFGSTTLAQTDKKVVVCSTTQVADFARNVVGDRWVVHGVLAAGEDPHTYETGADDSRAVANADLCLDNGWHLEGNDWMRRLADLCGTPVVSCIDGIEPLELEEDDGTMINDPHAWFSPANAATYVDNICSAVCELDPDHAEEFKARAELYKIQLVALERWIQRQLAQIPGNQRILVTHHDAFGYFCTQYGFQAFSPQGWTTSELIDVTITDKKAIVDKIRELGVRSIFVETTINRELLDEIARDAGVQVGGKLYSDAMGAEGNAAETYIGMMRENVLTLVRSLK